MESARVSPPPATVGLVRADLAEMWTIDHPEGDSPSSPESVYDASDLDLESVRTPGFRPSKMKRNDPLAEMLVGVLDPTPKRARASDKHHEAEFACDHLPEVDDNGSTLDDRQTGRSGCFQPSLNAEPPGRLSGRTAHPESAAVTNGSGCSSSGESPGSAACLRGRTNKQVSVASPLRPSSTTASRPQRGSNSKGKESAATRRRLARLPELDSSPLGPVKQVSTRAKAKTRKRDGDVFELSDSTEGEHKPRAKKRHAKDSSPKGLPPPPNSSPLFVDAEAAAPNRHHKRTRLPKSTNQGEIQEHTAENRQQHNTAGDAEQECHLSSASSRRQDNKTSTKRQPCAEGGAQMDLPESSSRKTDASATANRPKPSSTKGNEADLQPEPVHISILSSDSEAARHNAPRLVAMDGSSGAIVPELAVRSDSKWLIHEAGKHSPPPSRFAPPPFRPSRQLGTSGTPQKRSAMGRVPYNDEHHVSDEHPHSMSPPVPTHPGDPVGDNLKPEDIWKQAAADDSPPAILNRVVHVSTLAPLDVCGARDLMTVFSAASSFPEATRRSDPRHCAGL